MADVIARNFEIEEHDAEEIIEWERTRQVPPECYDTSWLDEDPDRMRTAHRIIRMHFMDKLPRRRF